MYDMLFRWLLVGVGVVTEAYHTVLSAKEMYISPRRAAVRRAGSIQEGQQQDSCWLIIDDMFRLFSLGAKYKGF